MLDFSRRFPVCATWQALLFYEKQRAQCQPSTFNVQLFVSFSLFIVISIFCVSMCKSNENKSCKSKHQQQQTCYKTICEQVSILYFATPSWLIILLFCSLYLRTYLRKKVLCIVCKPKNRMNLQKVSLISLFKHCCVVYFAFSSSFLFVFSGNKLTN